MVEATRSSGNVATDRGQRRFVVDQDDHIRRLEEGRHVITDSHGMRTWFRFTERLDGRAGAGSADFLRRGVGLTYGAGSRRSTRTLRGLRCLSFFRLSMRACTRVCEVCKNVLRSTLLAIRYELRIEQPEELPAGRVVACPRYTPSKSAACALFSVASADADLATEFIRDRVGCWFQRVLSSSCF